MNKRAKLFMLFAILLTSAMAWANHRGLMASSLFNHSDAANRTASGNVNHK